MQRLDVRVARANTTIRFWVMKDGQEAVKAGAKVELEATREEAGVG